MNKLIQIIQSGNWNQDSIARAIISKVRLNLSDSTLNFNKVCYVVRTKEDVANLDLRCDNSLEVRIVQDIFVNDCIQIRSNIPLEGYYIEDNIFHKTDFVARYDEIVETLNRYVGDQEEVLTFLYRAHRDAIQLIPPNRYVGGGLDGVSITKCVIASEGMLQPIFSSDGWYTNLNISDNVVSTKSQHDISIAGVLSGTFEENYDLNGNPIIPDLYPARLGGGKLNYHILSFSGRKRYMPVKGITGTPNDMRTIPRRGLNIDNLDLEEYNLEYAKLPTDIDRFERIVTVIDKLLSEGKITVYRKER